MERPTYNIDEGATRALNTASREALRNNAPDRFTAAADTIRGAQRESAAVGKAARKESVESAGPAAYRAMRDWSGGVPLGGWVKDRMRPPPVELTPDVEPVNYRRLFETYQTDWATQSNLQPHYLGLWVNPRYQWWFTGEAQVGPTTQDPTAGEGSDEPFNPLDVLTPQYTHFDEEGDSLG